MAAVRHFEFEKIGILLSSRLGIIICICVPNLVEIGWFPADI